jgi:hypothetical protein
MQLLACRFPSVALRRATIGGQDAIRHQVKKNADIDRCAAAIGWLRLALLDATADQRALMPTGPCREKATWLMRRPQ